MEITPRMINGYAWIAWFIYWNVAALFVHRTKSTEGFFDRLKHVLPLTACFYLIFRDRHYGHIFVGRLYESNVIEWLGTLLTFAGLWFSISARLHLGRYWSGYVTLKEGHKIIRTGPYRLVRHPIYTGLLLGAIGSALTSSTGDALLGIPILLLSFIYKYHREETLLTTEFGEEYLTFKRETPALIPFIY